MTAAFLMHVQLFNIAQQNPATGATPAGIAVAMRHLGRRNGIGPASLLQNVVISLQGLLILAVLVLLIIP